MHPLCGALPVPDVPVRVALSKLLKRKGRAGSGKLVALPILLVAPPILMELPCRSSNALLHFNIICYSSGLG